MKLLSLRRFCNNKEKLVVFPCFFTLANACLGFLAILSALEGDCVLASKCIILAGVMDFFDGQVARAFGATSGIGGELDSLSDAVSFCLAPMVVSYCWYHEQFTGYGLVVLLLYLCAGLVRLAKFNVTTHDTKDNFLGLPTTASALMLTSGLLSMRWIVDCSSAEKIFAYHALLFGILVISGLMISNIPFPAPRRVKSKLKKLLLLVVGICSLFLRFHMLFVCLVCYGLFGVVRFLVHKMKLSV